MAKLGRGFDEIRESLGYFGGDNESRDKKRKQKSGPQSGSHRPANVIKQRVPADIWNNYTKIATLRNPYERMISKYYDYMTLRNRHHPDSKEITFKQYIEKKAKNKRGIANFLYALIHIDGKSVLDYCIRYEHLAEDIKALEVKINCPGLYETMQNFSCNKESRPKEGASLYEVYTKYPGAKSMIDEDLSENWDKYELLREHWPKYQSELEKLLNTNQSGLYSKQE